MRLLIAFCMLMLIPKANACSCGEIPLIDKIENSNNVFVGSVVSLRDLAYIEESVRTYDKGVEITVRIEKSMKGENQESTKLYSTYGGGDCGLGSSFYIKQRILFFLRSDKVFMCQGHVTEEYFYSDEFSQFSDLLKETQRLIDSGI